MVDGWLVILNTTSVTCLLNPDYLNFPVCGWHWYFLFFFNLHLSITNKHLYCLSKLSRFMTNGFNFVKRCHHISERPVLKQRCTSTSNQRAARLTQTNGCCWRVVKGTELDSGEISVTHLQVISESVHASLTATVIIAAGWSRGSRLQCECAKQTFNATLEF